MTIVPMAIYPRGEFFSLPRVTRAGVTRAERCIGEGQARREVKRLSILPHVIYHRHTNNRQQAAKVWDI